MVNNTAPLAVDQRNVKDSDSDFREPGDAGKAAINNTKGLGFSAGLHHRRQGVKKVDN
jgi:hypothetical protein